MRKNPFAILSPILALAFCLPVYGRTRQSAQQAGIKVDPKDGLTYVWISPGRYQMGCSFDDAKCSTYEKPSHQVTIAEGFWIGQTPVTQVAYKKVVGTNPSQFKGDQLPVERVTWDEAKEYCERVEKRLPTEEEWEYAARGGNPGALYGPLARIAWYRANSGGRTHAVGQKQANGYGLYDMLGNVDEWVADFYKYYRDARVENRAGAQILTPTEGVDFASYIQHSLATVHRHWVMPQPEDDGVVRITLEINRDGSLTSPGPTLERTSGNESLDNAAMATIRASNSFEPLPPQFRGSFIRLRVIFPYTSSPSADTSLTPTQPLLPTSVSSVEVLSRVVRGASWDNDAYLVSVSNRMRYTPETATKTSASGVPRTDDRKQVQGVGMNDINCGRSYAGQILAIFNEAIANSTALWDYEPRTMASMEAWFDAKDNGGFPVIGVVDHADNLLAFGSYGIFRAWPAYKYSVELSVYVENRSRRHGLGRRVLKRLITEADSQGYHALIGGIESQNAASIELCTSVGFEKCAEIRHAGFKFGRWLDLLFYQMLLDGPVIPKEGNAR